uniref:Uncharacterized protein n=1 Tax=Anguilla anguilla TaxID=7936 RepID=A0A0E9XGD0_ANGAN
MCRALLHRKATAQPHYFEVLIGHNLKKVVRMLVSVSKPVT